MEYIVLDIEFNGRKFASELPMEVIEIGAVKLDPQLNNVGSFTSLVKPVYFAKLNTFIKQKTGISQEEIDTALDYPTVIRRFLEWLGPNDNLLFLTWGGEDLKRIVLDTRMHKLDDTYWMTAKYYDLLKGYTRSKGLKNDVSVEAALVELNIPQSGSAHRALDDAVMTAEIFKAVFNKLDLERIQQYEDRFTNSKERKWIRNAIRMLEVQKLPLEWEQLEQKFLKDKPIEDKRKAAELKQVFTAEAAKHAAKAKEAMKNKARVLAADSEESSEQTAEAPANANRHSMNEGQ